MTALMPQFHIARPRDVEAAVAARREHPGSRFLAGGTDLVVNMRHGIASPTLLIDLAEIGELAGIEATDAGVRIGASVTVAALPRSPILAERYRALAEAAEAIAGPGHRAMATVGGNLCLDTRCIFYNQSEWWRHANSYCLKHGGEVCHVAPQGQRCHAAFTGDLAPALLALGAEVEIAGAQQRRRIPLGELYVEDGKAHLALGCRRNRRCRAPAAGPAAVGLRQTARARRDRLSARRRGGGARDRERRGEGAPHRNNRHQFPPLPARRNRRTAGPADRRKNAAAGRSLGAETGAADADHGGLGPLPPARRRRPRPPPGVRARCHTDKPIVSDHHHCARPHDGSRLWHEADGLHIDVCGLEPPQPAVTILGLIDNGEAGATLTAHLDREPISLYPELEQRGWDYEMLSSCGHGAHDDEVKLRLVRLRA